MRLVFVDLASVRGYGLLVVEPMFLCRPRAVNFAGGVSRIKIDALGIKRQEIATSRFKTRGEVS